MKLNQQKDGVLSLKCFRSKSIFVTIEFGGVLMNMNDTQLRELTNKLLVVVEEVTTKFAEVKQSEQYEVDFYGEVQPFVNGVDRLIEQWQPLVMVWLESGRGKYLHKQQIESTVEHLKTVSVLVFQPKASKKRVIELLKSIRYVLDSLLSEIIELG